MIPPFKACIKGTNSQHNKKDFHNKNLVQTLRDQICGKQHCCCIVFDFYKLVGLVTCLFAFLCVVHTHGKPNKFAY